MENERKNKIEYRKEGDYYTNEHNQITLFLILQNFQKFY